MIAEWWSDPAYLGEFFTIAPRTRQMMEPWTADAHGPEKGWYLIIRREQQDLVGTIGASLWLRSDAGVSTARGALGRDVEWLL